MVKILNVGLKGWKKDNGTWSWTPEILMEFDPLAPNIEQHQRESIEKALEDARSVLQGRVEAWTNGNGTKPPAGKGTAIVSGVRPYDQETRKWSCCPTCGSEDIHKVSKVGDKPFDACYACKIFLGQYGTVTEMHPKGGQ